MLPRLCLVLLLAALAPLSAVEAAAGDPVREILAEHGPRWYDAPRDDYRRVEIRLRERENDSDGSSIGGPGSGQGLSILPILLYSLIGLLLIALIAWMLMSDIDLPQVEGRGGAGSALRPMADLSDLPFDVADTGDPEGALEQAIAAGDLRAALIWLYACLLLRLDNMGRLRLHRSKTNRCYLREMDPADPQRPLLGRTVEAFEAMYFGGAEPQRERVVELHAGYRALVAGGVQR